jgi:hypothetical protein
MVEAMALTAAANPYEHGLGMQAPSHQVHQEAVSPQRGVLVGLSPNRTQKNSPAQSGTMEIFWRLAHQSVHLPG